MPSKACQYVITQEIILKALKYVSIKYALVDLQKCITRFKSQKEEHEWMKARIIASFKPNKLNTPIKTR
jgi:hypothetical protein